jgi:hypothetical protein
MSPATTSPHERSPPRDLPELQRLADEGMETAEKALDDLLQ